MVWEEMSFEEFQYGCHVGHLGYQNGMILAILNFYVAWMPPIKFRLPPLMVWEEMPFEEFQDGRHWISEQNDFSNSEPLCCSNASNQVSAQSDTVWEEMLFEEFQDGRHGHLGYRNGMILAILNLHVATMPPTKFQLNPTYGSGRAVKNVQS